MKEDTVEEEDVESSLTDHEIDVEDIDDGDDGPNHLTGKGGGAVHLQRHRHQGSHSTLRSFKEEEDDEEDEVLDKEEMVDEDDVGGPPVGAVKSKKRSGKKSGKSSGNGSSGSSSSSNPQIKPKCNCEQLQLVDCHLETKELWDKFNELGTEMIITKTGRLVSSCFSLINNMQNQTSYLSFDQTKHERESNIPHIHVALVLSL